MIEKTKDIARKIAGHILVYCTIKIRKDRQVKKPDENPSVGLILCASKNDEVVEYAMSRTMSPMMVSQYQLQLPDKEVLRKKLQELANIPQIEG